MPKPRILFIEDERPLVQAVTWHLNREGFEVTAVHDGHEGLQRARTLLPDLILLDLMMPGMNGLEVCRELRGGDTTRRVPVIMITAKTEEVDQVVGYSMGADDYVPKPFSNKILVQRIKAVLRRTGRGTETKDDIVEHLGVRIDRIRHKITVDKRDLDLTPTEFRLLEIMLRQPGRAFSRSQLMDGAIGESAIVLERTIDVHVKSLRQKMGDDGDNPQYIETVRGVGYRFKENS